MKQFTRLALLTLIVWNTPSAAAPAQFCPGWSPRTADVAGYTTVPCAPGVEAARNAKTDVAAARCHAIVTSDVDRLLALHRSVRDGGLGVLRVPTAGADSAPATAKGSHPTGCDLG